MLGTHLDSKRFASSIIPSIIDQEREWAKSRNLGSIIKSQEEMILTFGWKLRGWCTNCRINKTKSNKWITGRNRGRYACHNHSFVCGLNLKCWTTPNKSRDSVG